MIDTEVIRLRKLRNTALRARAIAAALNDRPSESDSVFSRITLACWRISRVATGKLRAHPYPSYQRGPGYLRSLYDGAAAAMAGAVARNRGGGDARYLHCLHRVARELDDARALTWSPQLSDALGRLQSEIRLLMKELAAGERVEAGSRHEAASRCEAGAVSRRSGTSGVAANWPYLAF